MEKALEFIFADAWHFLGAVVLLIICTMWKPIDITIMNGRFDEKKTDEQEVLKRS